MRQRLNDFIKNNNAVFPQFNGEELEEFVKQGTSARNNNSNSSDIISLRKEVYEIVAQAFKIPLTLMTGNLTNINDIVTMYLSFCVDPIANMIGEELTRKQFTFGEWRLGNYVEVDTSCINHLDILEVADKVDKLVSSGVACIDEVRKRLGMNLLNTDFSQQHFITKNYEEIEKTRKEGGES